MSLIEGGGKFVDYNKKQPFITTDAKEWEEHLRKEGVTLKGEMPCGLCNKQVKFNDLKFGKQPICDKCKEDLK